MDKQAEMTMELKKARKWILGVGIVMVLVDVIVLYAIYGNQLSSQAKAKLMTYDAVILGFFIAMWVFAKYKPVMACVLALCGFWALHLYIATLDPHALYQGILMKVLFTLALIRGIKSASRAQQLQRELAQVFE